MHAVHMKILPRHLHMFRTPQELGEEQIRFEYDFVQKSKNLKLEQYNEFLTTFNYITTKIGPYSRCLTNQFRIIIQKSEKSQISPKPKAGN